MKKLKASTEDKLQVFNLVIELNNIRWLTLAYTLLGMQSWEGNAAECEKRLNAHRIGVKNILQAMSDLQKEIKDTKGARSGAMLVEVTRIRQQVLFQYLFPFYGFTVLNVCVRHFQVADKLKQVQSLLIKTHARSVKDDRFTKIIKSFVASF